MNDHLPVFWICWENRCCQHSDRLYWIPCQSDIILSGEDLATFLQAFDRTVTVSAPVMWLVSLVVGPNLSVCTCLHISIYITSTLKLRSVFFKLAVECRWKVNTDGASGCLWRRTALRVYLNAVSVYFQPTAFSSCASNINYHCAACSWFVSPEWIYHE